MGFCRFGLLDSSAHKKSSFGASGISPVNLNFPITSIYPLT